jgi:hypothetical protein
MKHCTQTRQYYELTTQGKHKLSGLVGTHVENLQLGKQCKQVRPEISNMLNDLEILKSESVRIGFGLEPCLSDSDYMALAGRVKQKSFECVNIDGTFVQDRSNFEDWIRTNPRCVAFEVWERYNYIIFDDLSFEFRAEQHEKCNLAFDIAQERISCELVAEISNFVHRCDTQLAVSSTEEVCRQTIEIISSRHPGCDISFEAVAEAYKCGVEFKLIQQVYDSQCQLVLDMGTLSVRTETDCYPILAFTAKNK